MLNMEDVPLGRPLVPEARSYRRLAEAIFRRGPMLRFMTTMWGHCRVPGCAQFAGRNRKGRMRPLCKRHQGSCKFQKLSRG